MNKDREEDTMGAKAITPNHTAPASTSGAQGLLEMLRQRLIARARKSAIRVPTGNEAKVAVEYAHDVLIRVERHKTQD